MAKKSIINVTIADSGVITFAVDGAGSFEVSPAFLSDNIRQRALVHGLVQKISDAAAIPKADLPEGAEAIAKVKFEAMQSVADRLAEGDWSKRIEGGSGPVAGVIYRAFAAWVAERAAKAKKPAPADAEIRAVYDAKPRAEQLALRNVPEIAAIIERIKSERGDNAAKSVDTASLLGELGL